jgi:hypothetical protein
LYTLLKPLYSSNDYSYIDDTVTYINKLNEYGISSEEDLKDKMTLLCDNYNKDSLKQLLSKEYDENVSIIYDPSNFTTIVNDNYYIGTYEPKELLLTLDVPRVRYSMYLQKDAYSAMVKMYQAIKEEHTGFLLFNAYSNYESYEDKAGYSEEQLGLTITVAKSEIAYNQFGETDISQWLEEHAYEYGFVLRYPKHKASVTNHAYDAHIYRYVGKSLAKTLHDSSLTLEEFNNQ